MTVPGDVKVDDRGVATGVDADAGASGLGWFRLLHVALLGVTIAGVVVGLRVVVRGGIAPVDAVAFGLTLVWALVGFVDTRARERVGAKLSPYHLLMAIDALVGDGRAHGRPQGRDPARRTSARATWPRWRPSSSPRSRSTSCSRCPTGGSAIAPARRRRSSVYVAALASGSRSWSAHHPFTVVDGAISWTIAGGVALAPMRARYAASIGHAGSACSGSASA